MSIDVQYQEWSPNTNRPDDAALNEDKITVNSISDIPANGDYVCFKNGDSYKIRSRFFTYLTDEKILANIVVEVTQDLNALIKS